MCKNAERGHTVSPDTSAIGSSCGVKRGVNYTRRLIGRLVPVGQAVQWPWGRSKQRLPLVPNTNEMPPSGDSLASRLGR